MSISKSGKPSIWRIILSTLAAAFGVQSSHNRERDFTHGNIYIYIVAGILFTVFFIVAIAMIVHLTLGTSI
jgi:Protein of unknown function (DUF2970)